MPGKSAEDSSSPWTSASTLQTHKKLLVPVSDQHSSDHCIHLQCEPADSRLPSLYTSQVSKPIFQREKNLSSPSIVWVKWILWPSSDKFIVKIWEIRTVSQGTRHLEGFFFKVPLRETMSLISYLVALTVKCIQIIDNNILSL